MRVTPRSSRDAIEGVDEAGELRVRVTAPPADGAANAAVARLLAKELGVPKGAVTIAAGRDQPAQAAAHRGPGAGRAARAVARRQRPGRLTSTMSLVSYFVSD